MKQSEKDKDRKHAIQTTGLVCMTIIALLCLCGVFWGDAGIKVAAGLFIGTMGLIVLATLNSWS